MWSDPARPLPGLRPPRDPGDLWIDRRGGIRTGKLASAIRPDRREPEETEPTSTSATPSSRMRSTGGNCCASPKSRGPRSFPRSQSPSRPPRPLPSSQTTSNGSSRRPSSRNRRKANWIRSVGSITRRPTKRGESRAWRNRPPSSISNIGTRYGSSSSAIRPTQGVPYHRPANRGNFSSDSLLSKTFASITVT